MTHPFIHARVTPNKPAIIMAETGKQISYRELEERANRTAQLLRSLGLVRGDAIAALFENCIELFVIAWAAQRTGLYFTAISSRLTRDEIDYIIKNSQATALFTTSRVGPVVNELTDVLDASVPLFMAAPAIPPYRDWETEAAAFPSTPVADEKPGELMLYSSGTTGQPKGIKRPMPEGSILTAPYTFPLMKQVFGANEETVYLSPAPLYHAAPLGWTMNCQRLGGTAIVMEKFDEENVLRFIEKYEVTMGQFVPTHFIRMLKLPEDLRSKYDLSSLRLAFHAAAPCPIPVKEKMLEWWGPIIHEYYAGTEGCGITFIGPREWEEKKGSVGKAIGCQVHACDEDGEPLPAGETGQIFFAGGPTFEYHGDAEKSAKARNRHGWSSMGDIGHVDQDGYLFLTDRKSFVIISGGVNIYPQEIENLLVTHPKITDVAVIGVPDEVMGERVVAVVQPLDPADAGPELAKELELFCRQKLSGVKVPRQFDFTDALPRHPTGKLYKRVLRDKYLDRSSG